MIDVKFLRENPEIVKENIRKKFQDVKLPLVDEVIEYDEKSRTAQGEADKIRAERKKLSKEIGKLMGQAKKDPSKMAEVDAVKAKVNEMAERLEQLDAIKKGSRRDRPQGYDGDPEYHRSFRSDRSRRFSQR